MNVYPIDVVKLVRSYILSKYVATIYSTAAVFTGPQEENEQAPMKYFVTLLYDSTPDYYEVGDANSQTLVSITAKIGERIVSTATTGQKEATDTFRQFTARKLRSREFQNYMAQNGVTPAPITVVEVVDVPMDRAHPGMHLYYITVELLTYIDNTN